MSKVLIELPSDLDSEYKGFIRDTAKLLTVSVIFYLLYIEVFGNDNLSDKNFTNLISFLIIGLAAYHLVVSKIVNLD